MENKKTKLTLSGIAKKSISNIDLDRYKNKNSVIIEKKTGKFFKKGSFSKPFKQNYEFDEKPSATSNWPNVSSSSKFFTKFSVFSLNSVCLFSESS